jgi:hypothetical protein
VKNKGLIIGGIAAGLVLLFAFIVFVPVRIGIHNTGIQKEEQILHQNNDNTILLNQMVAGVYDQVHIANLKSAQMDKILKDAVSGQLQLTGNQKGSLFSALTEAYPNLDLSIYDRIATYVQGKRDAYQNAQQLLQDRLRDFDTWRLSFPASMFAGSFPDSNLYCSNDSGQRLTGATCENYLNTISQPNGSNNGGGQNGITIPTN